MDPVTKHTLDYVKADIDSMKRALDSVNWANLLCDLSADGSWSVFKNMLDNTEQQFIPMKKLRQKSFKPVWMTHAAYKAVRQRRQVYTKYKSTSHPAYIRAASQQSVPSHYLLVNTARRLFEEKLAKNIREDRKSFFAFARSTRKPCYRKGDRAMRPTECSENFGESPSL